MPVSSRLVGRAFAILHAPLIPGGRARVGVRWRWVAVTEKKKDVSLRRRTLKYGFRPNCLVVVFTDAFAVAAIEKDVLLSTDVEL